MPLTFCGDFPHSASWPSQNRCSGLSFKYACVNAPSIVAAGRRFGCTFFRVFAMVQSTSTRRGFSLSDANATLPLVRSIVADLIELHAAVVAREARIEFLLGKRTDKPRDAYDDELREVQRSLTDDRQQLARYEAEIESLGIRIRTASEGLMEFPSYLGETPVCLLWRPGDQAISAWASVDGEEHADLQGRVFTAGPESEPPFRRRTR